MAVPALAELVLSAERTEDISFSQAFSAVLALGVLDPFLDETLPVEDLLLEEVDGSESHSDGKEDQEVVPEYEDLEVLQELHERLQEPFRDDVENSFAYLPEDRDEHHDEQMGGHECLSSVFSPDGAVVPVPYEEEEGNEEQEFHADPLQRIGEIQAIQCGSQAFCQFRGEVGKYSLEIGILFDKRQVRFLFFQHLAEFLRALLDLLSDDIGTGSAYGLSYWLFRYLFLENGIVASLKPADIGLDGRSPVADLVPHVEEFIELGIAPHFPEEILDFETLGMEGFGMSALGGDILVGGISGILVVSGLQQHLISLLLLGGVFRIYRDSLARIRDDIARSHETRRLVREPLKEGSEHEYIEKYDDNERQSGERLVAADGSQSGKNRLDFREERELHTYKRL